MPWYRAKVALLPAGTGAAGAAAALGGAALGLPAAALSPLSPFPKSPSPSLMRRGCFFTARSMSLPPNRRRPTVRFSPMAAAATSHAQANRRAAMPPKTM